MVSKDFRSELKLLYTSYCTDIQVAIFKILWQWCYEVFPATFDQNGKQCKQNRLTFLNVLSYSILNGTTLMEEIVIKLLMSLFLECFKSSSHS